MPRKRATRYTPAQLQEWESIRTSETPFNPKTGASIKAGGPKFQELEQAFAEYKAEQATLAPEPEKAAASRDKIRDVLTAVMQETARRDPRTAAKIGMLTKDLHEDYQRTVRQDGSKRPSALFDHGITIALLEDALETYNRIMRRNQSQYRLLETSEFVQRHLTALLNQRMKYVRDISRAQAVAKLTKPSDVPRTQETLRKVWSNFKRKYDEGRFKTHVKRMIIADLEELGDQDEADFSPLYKTVMTRIYNYFDIPKDIAVFYTQYIMVYMKFMIYNAMNRYINRNYVELIQTAPTNGVRDIKLTFDDFRY